MTFSILITNYKRAELLKWNLLSLARQKVFYPFEVIVLNDGLPDDTGQVCNSYKNRLNIKYIFTGQRNLKEEQWRCPGFAVNIGAKQAKGENIIISCAEMFLVDDALQTMIEPLLKNKKLLTIPYGKDDGRSLFLNHLNKNEGTVKDCSIYENLAKLQIKLPFFMGMSKQQFMEIGGYDEDYTGHAYDDTDLVHRLHWNKCVFRQVALKVVHLYHPRLSHTRSSELARRHAYNRTLIRKKEGTKDKREMIVANKNREWGKL